MTITNHRIDAHSNRTFGYDDLSTFLSMMTGDEKHSEAATSTLDVIWTLYDRVLKVDPSTVDDPDRDRFFLSKGHGPMAYYAVLAAKGFIPVEILPSFARFESPLGWSILMRIEMRGCSYGRNPANEAIVVSRS